MISKTALVKRVLSDARYDEAHRFPKWNIKPTVLEEPRLFRQVFPEIDKAGHVQLANYYKALAQKLDRQYYDAMEKAVAKYGESGPQISAIGRAGNFPESVKDRLRTLAHSSTLAWKAAGAHEKASKLRRQ